MIALSSNGISNMCLNPRPKFSVSHGAFAGKSGISILLRLGCSDICALGH